MIRAAGSLPRSRVACRHALCAMVLAGVAHQPPALAEPADPNGEWRVGPAFLTDHTAVYDPVHDRVIVFGGQTAGGAINDVFAIDLAGPPAWTSIVPAGTPPSPRAGHTAIYDPVRNRMVVFGGSGGAPKYNDVWELTLSGQPEWHPLATAGTPPLPNWDHAAIYDPVGDRMIVVGGAWDSDHAVWALTLSGTPTWSELVVAGLAEVHAQHTMVYDPVGHRAIVLGVNSVQTISLSGSPAWGYLPGYSAVTSHQTAVYDPGGHRVIVYGGGDGFVTSPRAAALSLGSSTWAELPAGRRRMQHAAIHDPVRNRMLAYGGWWAESRSTDSWNDVQALSLTGAPAWSAVSAGPGHGYAYSAVWDPSRGQAVAFGGCLSDGYMGGCACANRAWSLSPGLAWTEVLPGGLPPEPRADHAAIYDPPRDRMLVFGGAAFIGSGLSNEVWSLTLAEPRTWALVATAGTPPSARYQATAIYDPVRDRMLVFGGFDGGHLQDVWALSLSGTPTWTLLSPISTAPAPRSGHVAIHDPVRDRMFVFGGYDGTYMNDLWALELGGAGEWVQIVPSGAPPAPRSESAACYDSRRDRMLLHGGAGGASFGDVFALSLSGTPSWSPLAPSGTPPSGRQQHAAVYDEERDRMIIFGSAPMRDDVWVLNFGEQVDVEPARPPAFHLSAARPNPTRAGATFVLDLPASAAVRAEIYDLAGRRLAQFVNGRLEAGRHRLRWDGWTSNGARARAGLYYCRVTAGEAKLGRSFIVLN